MYIYHALVNAPSMIHINLNMIFYTHVEHNPTKTVYIKYYKIIKKLKNTHYTHTRTHARTHTTDCSRNWVLILVRMEILWEEESFQFGFKRCKSLPIIITCMLSTESENSCFKLFKMCNTLWTNYTHQQNWKVFPTFVWIAIYICIPCKVW